MAKPMRLRCRISIDNQSPWMYRVNSVLFDETPLSFKTEKHNIELNDEITDEQSVVDGWVQVVQVAQQGDQVYITLPSPSLEFGSNVNVRETYLMPPGVTIDRFRAS